MPFIQYNFRIVEVATHLSIDTMVSRRRASEILLIVHQNILSPWENITEKHGSVPVSTLGVVVTLGGVRGKVEAIAKSLKINVPTDILRVQPRA